jgi:Periplasmic binding protein-like domain
MWPPIELATPRGPRLPTSGPPRSAPDVIHRRRPETAPGADHLVGFGHRHIAHVDGGRAPGPAERRRGYHAAPRRHGPAPEIRIPPGSPGTKASRLPARYPTPTRQATACNDRRAAGVLDVLSQAGLEVTGGIRAVADSNLARLAHINRTTIARGIRQITTLAVSPTIDRLTPTLVARRELATRPTSSNENHRAATRRTAAATMARTPHRTNRRHPPLGAHGSRPGKSARSQGSNSRVLL